MDAIEQRIERLERRAEGQQRCIQRQRWGLVLLTLTVAASLTIAATDNGRVHDVLRTRRLEVMNEQDSLVVEVQANVYGGLMVILDIAGRCMAEVAAQGSLSGGPGGQILAGTGGQISIYKNPGKGAARMTTHPFGASLTIWNDAGADVAGVAAAPNGGQLDILNSSGQIAVQASADDSGHGHIGVFDGQGKGRTSTPR